MRVRRPSIMKKNMLKLALITTAVLMNASPALASSVDVTGNGADSSNTANVVSNRTTTIFQSNIGTVTNSVAAKSSTGDNTANKNTGGDTSINTGDASTKVVANNSLNKNTSTLACCPDKDSFAVKIAGNGADSENNVNLALNNSIDITDTKTLDIKNNFKVASTTGNNQADKNTGGDSRITTGDSTVAISIDNVGNINKITIGKLPTIPGVTPLPNPPVVANAPAASVLGVINQLPNTGFDLGLVLLVTLGLVGAGLALRQIETASSKISALLSH